MACADPKRLNCVLCEERSPILIRHNGAAQVSDVATEHSQEAEVSAKIAVIFSAEPTDI